jgi:carotenoid isomerooxygenase
MHQCRVLTKIPSRWAFNPSYMHTFAITDHYIILIEQSLCVSLVQMVQVTIKHGPMTDALVWHGNEPVRYLTAIEIFF